MSILLEWTKLRNEPPLAPTRVSMGNGRFLAAEDVLEGHFHRLTTQPGTQTVTLQVKDDLSAAITVLAPELTPLTRVAQEVAQTVPAVQPEPRFRENLHSALERTHRQHTAQRVLGTRSPTPTGRSFWRTVAPVAVLILALFALWVYFLPAQRNSSKRA
jgi:hypothetical protein